MDIDGYIYTHTHIHTYMDVDDWWPSYTGQREASPRVFLPHGIPVETTKTPPGPRGSGPRARDGSVGAGDPRAHWGRTEPLQRGVAEEKPPEIFAGDSLGDSIAFTKCLILGGTLTHHAFTKWLDLGGTVTHWKNYSWRSICRALWARRDVCFVKWFRCPNFFRSVVMVVGIL